MWCGEGKLMGGAASACRLDVARWMVILQAAIEKMDWSGDDGDMDCSSDISNLMVLYT